MFQIKDGKITLDKSRTLTPRQLATIKNMPNETERNTYIMSLMGLYKRRCPVQRVKNNGYDLLKMKHEGSVSDLMKSLRRVNLNHKPNEKGIGQWVGVEVECIIPHSKSDNECECTFDDDGDLENECGWCSDGQLWSEDDAHRWLKTELVRAGVNRCQVKEDGSLEDGDGHGVEVTILFNSAYGFDPLHKLCDTLKSLGCYVNDSCGLHVHLDARHLTMRKAEAFGFSLGCAMPVFKYMVAPSRLANDYCRLEVSPLMRVSHDDDNWDLRYAAINLTSYPKYKTIEVRLHQGTLDSYGIENWVKMLKVVGKAKLKEPVSTFQEFIDITGFNEGLVTYCEKQINKHNPEAFNATLNAEPARLNEVTNYTVGA